MLEKHVLEEVEVTSQLIFHGFISWSCMSFFPYANTLSAIFKTESNSFYMHTYSANKADSEESVKMMTIISAIKSHITLLLLHSRLANVKDFK